MNKLVNKIDESAFKWSSLFTTDNVKILAYVLLSLAGAVGAAKALLQFDLPRVVHRGAQPSGVGRPFSFLGRMCTLGRMTSIPFPIQCKGCGSIYESPIWLGVGSSVLIEDVGLAPCPACNGPMRIPDGVYKLQQEGSKLVLGVPAETRNLLRALEVRPDDSPAQTIAKVEKVAPDVAEKLKKWLELAMLVFGFLGAVAGPEFVHGLFKALWAAVIGH